MSHPGIATADLLTVRTPAVNFHVLRDGAGLHLLDAGFIGGESFLMAALRKRGWEREKIVGVIVTHGHLDHILNVAKIARKHGAWIAAPRLDADHYAGRPSYAGWSRIAGGLEMIGRPVLGFEPFVPDRWLDDGDVLDVWHGLRAVHLPGHTAGHTGYFCEELGLLFAADLFASYPRFTHFPPRVFNSERHLMKGSLERALSLGLKGVLPNHGDGAATTEHLRRLETMAEKLR
jgi:glyoxylase-like metal-dependent hydrolase (beta-lactamase superfamily II)